MKRCLWCRKLVARTLNISDARRCTICVRDRSEESEEPNEIFSGNVSCSSPHGSFVLLPPSLNASVFDCAFKHKLRWCERMENWAKGCRDQIEAGLRACVYQFEAFLIFTTKKTNFFYSSPFLVFSLPSIKWIQKTLCSSSPLLLLLQYPKRDAALFANIKIMKI